MRTNVAIVVDRSSSIEQYRLTNHVRQMVNDVIGTLARIERDTGQEYVIDLWTFADEAKQEFSGFTANTFPAFVKYAPYGNTALYDAVNQAICTLSKTAIANLVIVITDGEENRSVMTYGEFADLVRWHQDGGKYTFVFHVPQGKKDAFVRRSDVPAGNVQEWEQTEAGTRQVSQSHDVALQRYSTLRAKGETQTHGYFTTDASGISDRDIAAYRCNKSRFKLYTMPKEGTAKEFAEGKTGSHYVIGQLFYQLMKLEKVQASKNIILREKTTGNVFAGSGLRGLLGIPEETCKVDPGNHANYDVFVQSTSVNRKLPRGTKVLIDTHQLSDDPPTWDHTAVAKKNLSEREKKLLGVK